MILRLLALFFLVFSLGCARHPASKRIVAAGDNDAVRKVQDQGLDSSRHYPGGRSGVWTGPKLAGVPSIKWTVSVPGPVVYPLILADGDVFAIAGGSLFKITASGSILWETKVLADGPIAWDDGRILVPTVSGTMHSIDAETGKFAASYAGFESIRSPALPLGGRKAWIERDGILLTKDSQNGPILTGPVSDAASDSSRFFVGNIHGIAAAVSEAGLQWSSRVDGPVTGQPIVAGDVVYFPYGPNSKGRGGIAAFGRQDGQLIWNTAFGPGVSAPCALGDVLIVPSRDSDLVALDPKHGGTRWRSPIPTPISSKPLLVDDAIYVGDGDGRVRRYDVEDGGSVWSIELGSAITGDGVILDGLLIVGTADGRIIGLAE